MLNSKVVVRQSVPSSLSHTLYVPAATARSPTASSYTGARAKLPSSKLTGAAELPATMCTLVKLRSHCNGHSAGALLSVRHANARTDRLLLLLLLLLPAALLSKTIDAVREIDAPRINSSREIERIESAALSTAHVEYESPWPYG